jgi:hypothetical protein
VFSVLSHLRARSVCSAQTSVRRRQVSANTVLPSETHFKDTNLERFSVDYCTREGTVSEIQVVLYLRGELPLFWGGVWEEVACVPTP